jgi:hypothetical protein
MPHHTWLTRRSLKTQERQSIEIESAPPSTIGWFAQCLVPPISSTSRQRLSPVRLGKTHETGRFARA